MRQLFLLGLLLILMGVGATAKPVCDYRSPRTDLADLGISFAYTYHNDPYGLSDQDRNFGQLNIAYLHLFDSPDFGFDLSVKNDMTISVLRLSTYLTTAEGSLKRYFVPDASFFGFAGVSGKSASSYETIRLAVNLGVGYGRFTDVTPLAKAMKIDAYLVKQKSITGHLDDVDLDVLAYEIGSLNIYESLADLLAVLQEIIEGTGLAKAGGLDALDIYEMARIIEDDTYSRYCGGDIKVGLGYEILDPFRGTNDFLITTAFNYAFATTPQAQFLIQGTFSGSYDILQTHEVKIGAAYDYLITDYLSATSSYCFARETWNGVATDIHNLSLEVEITPVKDAHVSLVMHFSHEPHFLEWSTDISLSIGMDLL